MHKLQEIIRLHRLGVGVRAIARQLRISPNTERVYRRVFQEAGVLLGKPEDLPSVTELQALVEAARPAPRLPQQRSSIETWRPRIEALLNAGATPTAIYDRLRVEESGFTGSLSAVKRMAATLRRARGVGPDEVAIPVETLPGQVAQVDFGAVGKLWDPRQQRMRTAYVFVMVLGCSRHQFARLVFDQKVETWLALHAEAFEHFGGVPEVVVPDNLKSAVLRAAFDVRREPVLNRSYRDFARHHGFQMDPTPPYSPEKKGKVESGVRYAKNNFMKTIGEERDIEELNRQLDRWVMEVAGMRRHGTTHRRPREHFEEVEREALLPLPKVKWKATWWREVTVHRDCCVLVEKARYSVPWRHVGRTLLARVTADSVVLYWDETRVAAHSRAPAGEKSVQLAHLPPGRGEYRERQPAYWLERAAELGEDVHTFVRGVFNSDPVLSQLKKVQAVVRYLRDVPKERANAACRRASFYGSYSYAAIKEILRKGLDLEPLPPALAPPPWRP